MGILFVLLFWMIILSGIALLAGLVALLIAVLVARGANKGRKLLLAFCSPGVAIFSYAACSLICMSVIAMVLHIDPGIGDSWVAPLRYGYELSSVDLPESASVTKEDGEIVLDGIERVELRDDSLIGSRWTGKDGRYFIFNLKTGNIRRFDNLSELSKNLSPAKPNLISNEDFYWQTRKYAYITAGILCLLLTFGALYGFWKVGLSIPGLKNQRRRSRRQDRTT